MRKPYESWNQFVANNFIKFHQYVKKLNLEISLVSSFAPVELAYFNLQFNIVAPCGLSVERD